MAVWIIDGIISDVVFAADGDERRMGQAAHGLATGIAHPIKLQFRPNPIQLSLQLLNLPVLFALPSPFLVLLQLQRFDLL